MPIINIDMIHTIGIRAILDTLTSNPSIGLYSQYIVNIVKNNNETLKIYVSSGLTGRGDIFDDIPPLFQV
ncbi:hypothetical protein ACFLYQ_07975 [Chloroflexota bacterium]